MIPERITKDTPALEREGHEFRYRLAKGFVGGYTTVIDVACGSAYGAPILATSSDRVHYVGVDKTITTDPNEWWMATTPPFTRLVQAHLESWIPDVPFDVAVCFETIEHLDDYSFLLFNLKKARKWVLISVPVVPTVGINPWHVHDFKPGEMVDIFEDDDWRLYQMVQQPSEVSEIYVFCRR